MTLGSGHFQCPSDIRNAKTSSRSHTDYSKTHNITAVIATSDSAKTAKSNKSERRDREFVHSPLEEEKCV